MTNRSMPIKLLAPLLLATATLAGGGLGGPSQIGSITADDPTWDRPTSTGTTPNGSCNVFAADSLNDSVHYDVYYIRGELGASFLDATITSTEPNPIDFDPMVVVYCGVFDPNQPLVNVIDIDDDSNGYPNALILAESGINLGQVYSLVVSSYSNHPPSMFGQYTVSLAPGLYFSTACQPDFNGDGILDFYDISEFLSRLSAMNPSADLNLDGNFDFDDVSLFLTQVNSGCP